MNSPDFWSIIVKPAISDGITSGVSWIRLNLPPIERERAVMSWVLPTPGTSSRRTWPSQRREEIRLRTVSFLPTITWPIESARILILLFIRNTSYTNNYLIKDIIPYFCTDCKGHIYKYWPNSFVQFWQKNRGKIVEKWIYYCKNRLSVN